VIFLKANELRDMTDDELQEKLQETRRQLFNLRFQQATGQLDNPRKLRLVRQDIARILTVRNQRQAEAQEA
jgi:large subunit ribosomal protein L29